MKIQKELAEGAEGEGGEEPEKNRILYLFQFHVFIMLDILLPHKEANDVHRD